MSQVSATLIETGDFASEEHSATALNSVSADAMSQNSASKASIATPIVEGKCMCVHLYCDGQFTGHST